MAPRANWKGFLKVGELACPVALYSASSSSERMAFHTLNRDTGHRVHREYVDNETGKVVPRENQVKGYEVDGGDYVMLEPEEVAAAIPDSDKTLAIDSFIACDDIDDVYLDRPYYLAPSGAAAEEAFAVIREGMRRKNVAALARTVLFRRMRTLLIRAHDCGLIATTLNFDYEVRSAEEAFGDIPTKKLPKEMMDLAKHIIKTKAGKFDPNGYEDRYEAALADLVRAKLEGKSLKRRKPEAESNVVDLMDALRQSAGRSGKKSAKAATGRKRKASTTSRRRPSRKTAAKRTPAKKRKAR